MTAPIQFHPAQDRSVGGRIVLLQALTEQQIYEHYQQWRAAHPGRLDELSFDAAQQCLHIGHWEIEAEDDAALTREYSILSFEDDAQSNDDQPVAQAQGTTATEPQPNHGDVVAVADLQAPAPANAEEVRAILSPTNQLPVSTVYEGGDMVRARNLQRTAVINNTGARKIEPAGAARSIQVKAGTGPIATRPGAHKLLKTPRLVLGNQPEQQRRYTGRHPDQFNHENDMGNKHNRNRPASDQQGQARPPGAQRDPNPKPQRRPEERDNQGQQAPREGAQRHPRQPHPVSHGSYTHSTLNAAPATAEDIAKLLQTGVGGAAIHVQPEFLDNLRDRQATQRLRSGGFNFDQQPEDGVNCINVSAAATTELGMALRLAQKHIFDHPQLGRFESLAGLYLMLVEQQVNGSHHTCYGANTNKVLYRHREFEREYDAVRRLRKNEALNDARGAFDFPVIFAIMLDSLWKVVNQDTALAQAMLDNKLEYACYTMPSAEEMERTRNFWPRRPQYGLWYVPLLHEVAYTLKLRLEAMRNGRAVDQLPTFNVARAVERGVHAVRERILGNMRRRNEDFLGDRPREPRHQQPMDPASGDGSAKTTRGERQQRRGDLEQQPPAGAHAKAPHDPFVVRDQNSLQARDELPARLTHKQRRLMDQAQRAGTPDDLKAEARRIEQEQEVKGVDLGNGVTLLSTAQLPAGEAPVAVALSGGDTVEGVIRNDGVVVLPEGEGNFTYSAQGGAAVVIDQANQTVGVESCPNCIEEPEEGDLQVGVIESQSGEPVTV